jgi:PST family polysaccharide transporter
MARRHIASNVLALYAIQGMQYVFPLLVLPIVTRAIGPERYGTLSFWQALAALLSLVVEYGFNYTSIRAINQTDCSFEKSIIFWSTTWAKLALLVPATAILVVTAVAISDRAEPLLVFATWLPVLAAALSPGWYYIATRNTVAVATISAGTSLISFLTMLAFVNTPVDFDKAVLIQLGMPLVAAILLLAYQRARLSAGRPRFAAKDVFARLREGLPLFVMALGAGAYSSFNPFLLGLVTTSPQVANFALGERLVRAAKNAVQPILTAMYPYAVERDAGSEGTRRNLRRAAFATFTLSLIIATLLCVLAPSAVRLVSGTAFLGAISATQILSANVAVVTAGHLLGVQYLVARGKEKIVTVITVAAAPVHLASFLAAGHYFGAIGGAIAYVGIECLVTIAFGLIAIEARKST